MSEVSSVAGWNWPFKALFDEVKGLQNIYQNMASTKNVLILAAITQYSLDTSHHLNVRIMRNIFVDT